jgi:hypothetical protein
MTFGQSHYVPVLKIKRGEKKALTQIPLNLRRRVTPLLEIVERKEDKAPTVEKHLDTAFAQLAESVMDYPRCLLDAREIEPDGEPAAAAVFERASAEGISFTPVTGLSRSSDVVPALQHRHRGLAIRLTREDLEGGHLAHRLTTFVHEHSLARQELDLILDLGAVDDLVMHGIRALADSFLSAVPDPSTWRNLIMSACAFPLSMGGVDRHSHDFVERSDWLAWRDGMYARRNEVSRFPTFSDCAIQHPTGVEGFDPRYMAASASIRYTIEEAWLLVKGESSRRTRTTLQFPRLATQLVYGHLREYFAGADHCAGCASIKAAADGAPGLGSAEVWRRLGTIHHLTRVVQQLSPLDEP